MYKIITNGKIKIHSILNAMIPELLYAQLTDYSTSANKVDLKPNFYRIILTSLTMANKSKNACNFGAHCLPFLDIYFCFDMTQFSFFFFV